MVLVWFNNKWIYGTNALHSYRFPFDKFWNLFENLKRCGFFHKDNGRNTRKKQRVQQIRFNRRQTQRIRVKTETT